MEHRPLGRSGLRVPVVGMGTWKTFDVHGDALARDRRGVAEAAIGAGTTLFDTSPMYGVAQDVLSRAVRDRRDEVIIADKLWTSSDREAREQMRRSLEWYDGRVDVYQVHNLVAWKERLTMLEELRDRGAVRVIGATHYQRSAFPELMRVMRTGRVGMVQIPYNAVDRAVEREVLPLAADLGLGVLIMQPLGTGALVQRSPATKQLAPLAPFGVTTWAQALLKWILSDARVSAVLPATSKAARAVENARAGDPPWFDGETREYVARLAASL
ncbi:MAG TPA: aldo/keto reductase [Gemmatimonadaceae bacterium]|nr:aldo/keto reductase [Gemmatimonadaceae bacterium]